MSAASDATGLRATPLLIAASFVLLTLTFTGASAAPTDCTDLL